MFEKKLEQLNEKVDKIIDNDLKHIHKGMGKIHTKLAFINGEMIIIIPLVLATLGFVVYLALGR